MCAPHHSVIMTAKGVSTDYRGRDRAEPVGCGSTRWSRWIASIALLGAVACLGVVVLSGLAGTASAANGATVIDDCTVIDESGTYELDGPITDVNDSRMIGGSDNRATCIDVRASDVVIDGNGHVFDSADPGTFSEQRGIRVNGTVEARENVTVRDVTLTDWPRAVWVRNASDVTVENIDVRVREESIPRGMIGVALGRFSEVSDSAVRNSTFEDYYSAIDGGEENITVRNNVVEGEIDVGGANVTVVNNEITAFSDASEGALTVGGIEGTISGNTIEDGTFDVGGSNLSVRNNTVSNLTTREFAMQVDGDGHEVRNNTIASNERGLLLVGSEHRLRDNEVRNNWENVHLGVEQGVGQVGVSDFGSLDVDTSNTVDGEPIRLLHGVTDRTFTNADTGYLAVTNSSGVTVRGITLTNNSDGLFLYNVSDTTVEGATFRENGVGIEAAGGTDVTIKNATVSDNRRQGIVESAGEVGVSGLAVSNSTITGNGESGVYSLGPDLRAIGNEITDNGEGIATAGDNATILGNDVSSNAGDGINVEGSNVTVRANSVAGNDGMGVFLDYTGTPGSPRTGPGNVVRNNTVTDSGESGVVVQRNDVPVVGNTLLGNDEAGIQIKSYGDGSVVRNNTARDNRYGIRLYEYDSGLFDPELPVSAVLVEDNVVTGNDEGISVGSRSSNNTIRDNLATGNGDGIHLDDVGEHRILDNNASANTGDGIRFNDYHAPFDPQRVPILNNTALGNGDDGIELTNARPGDAEDPSGPFVVLDNAVDRNDDDGVAVDDARNVTVADNGRIHGNDGAGIRIEDGTNVSVRNHTVTGNGVGFLALSSGFTVADLNASGNDGDGIRIDDVAGLSLGASVTASDNAGNGIEIEDGRDVHVLGVAANDNGLDGIRFVDPTNSSIRDLAPSDNYAAGIAVVDDDFGQEGNVSVRNVTVRHNGIGIDVERVERTTITDSTITDGNASAVSSVADVDVVGTDPEDRIHVNGTGVVLESAGNASLLDNAITENDGKGIVATLSADGSRITGNDVTDNGGNGIEVVGASGPSTIANNVVSDNGGLELYDAISIGPNGENGVYLESSSNVTVRNNTIERNEKHGVRVVDESRDNLIAANTIRSHATPNETSHGVFIRGRGVSFGFPTDNAVVDNEITDNDYGITMFHDSDTTVRGNDIVRSGIGVRFGSDTEPISARETTECTDGGVLAFRNTFGGSTNGTVVDNHIESDETALKVVTHPTGVTTCDGAITDIDYDDPTVEEYLIANNHIEGAEALNVTNTRLDYPTSETYGSSFNGSNAWNVSKSQDGNVLGGPYRGGNYWATPAGTGFSQTCTDADGDGICDSARSIGTNNADYLPLAAAQPAFFDVAIDATTSPGVSGDAIDVTATITNTGNATATETIDLTVNGTVVGSVSRALDPGESTTETFTWDTGGVAPGAYTATVASGTGSASTALTIDPNVSVRIDATNDPVTDAGTLVVDVTATNNRDEPVSETIELLDVDGAVVDSREVSLGAGESASIDLAWSTSVGDAGTGEVTVRSEADADRTTVTVRSGAISACGEVADPGTYRLGDDLSFSDGPCLDVRAGDVTIDGQGHAIAGSGSDTGVLLNVGEGAGTDITLRNLTIRGVSDAVEIPVGDGESISGVALRNVSTADVEENAVSARLGENGVVDGLTVADSALTADSGGILIEEDFEAGLAVRDLRVRNTTVIAEEVGIELDLGYDRATVDGVAVTNSTVDTNDEGIEVNTAAEDTTVRNVTIADNVVETRYAALFVDYGGEGATVESVRIADNRLRSDFEEGLDLEGDDTATTARNVSIVANDITADSVGLDLTLDDDGITVESLRIAGNRIETAGSAGIALLASDSDVAVGAVLRNNTITSASTGIELELGDGISGGSAYDATVAENTVTGFTDAGIDIAEVRTNAATDLSIRDNEVGNGTTTATGIELRTEDGAAPGEGSIAVRNNSVRTGGDAVAIDGFSDRVDMIDISHNALLSAGFGVDNGASGGVNATMNYWAASDGPGSAGPYEDPVTGALADGSGSAVSNGSSATVANVRFDPFLTTNPIESDDPDPAFFDVAIDSTNEPIEVGGTLNVEVSVENTGGTAATREVTLSLGGTDRDSAAMTLAPGESTTVSLSWTTGAGDAGAYTATVATDDAADSTAVTVSTPVDLPPPVQPIDACTNVTAAGHYALTGNVSGSGACIDIETNDVIVDGMGHAIAGTGPGSGTGIRVGAGTAGHNVTIRNVTVRGWETGIDVRGIDDGRITDVEAVENGIGISVGTATVNEDPSDPRVMILPPSNVTLRENTVARNDGTGIALDRVTNATVAGNTVTDNNGSGVVFLASEGNAVANNTLTANGDAGLDITGRTITPREDQTADRLGEPRPDPDSNNNTVRNNTVADNGGGIVLASAPNSTVTANTVTGNDDGGLLVTADPVFGPSSNLTVADNTIATNNGSGIALFGPSSLPVFDNEVTNNTARANNGSGIVLVGTDGNRVRDNRVVANNGSGVTLLSAPADNELANNTAARNDRFGVFLSNSVDTAVTNNTATRNGRDGFFVSAPGETLEGNNATNNERDGFIVVADNVTLSESTATGNGRDGISVRGDDATVADGTANGNDRHGIHLRASDGGDVTNSVANGNDRHGVALNLSAADNDLTGTTANDNGGSGFALTGTVVAAPANNSLTDGVARTNGAWAVAIRNASGTAVDALDIGASTEPGTTLSFEGANVAVAANASPPANPDNESVGRYFDAEAVGEGAFLDVELGYTDDDVAGIDEASLVLRRYDGTEWTTVDSEPAPAENVVAANVTEFSTFGAFGAPGDESDDGDSGDGSDDDESGDVPTIGPGQPGFGPVLALVALLLALGFVAVRRHDR